MSDRINEGEVFGESCCYSDAYVVSDLHQPADKGFEDSYVSLERETYTNIQVDKVSKANLYQTVRNRTEASNELHRHSQLKEELNSKDTCSSSENGEIKKRKRRLALIILGIVALQILTVTMAVILPVSLFAAMRVSCVTSIETSCTMTIDSGGPLSAAMPLTNCATQNVTVTTSDTVPINAQCIQLMEAGADPGYHVLTTLEVSENNQMRCLCSAVPRVFVASNATNSVTCGLQVLRCA